MSFNINDLLKLLRASLLDVTVIKNAVKGNIYPHYIKQSSKLPCITFHFMSGNSILRGNELSGTVQCKIWTDSQNPTYFLHNVHSDIYSVFKQDSFHDANLDLVTTMSDHISGILPEIVDGNLIHYLPINLKCKAIFY